MTPKENTEKLIKKWQKRQTAINDCNRNFSQYIYKSDKTREKWQRRFELLEIMKQAEFDEKGCPTNVEFYNINGWQKLIYLRWSITDVYRIIQPTPEPRYIPYTINNLESIMLKRIRPKAKKDEQYLITGGFMTPDNVFRIIVGAARLNAVYVFEYYEYLDGTPFGKKVQ